MTKKPKSLIESYNYRANNLVVPSLPYSLRSYRSAPLTILFLIFYFMSTFCEVHFAFYIVKISSQSHIGYYYKRSKFTILLRYSYLHMLLIIKSLLVCHLKLKYCIDQRFPNLYSHGIFRESIVFDGIPRMFFKNKYLKYLHIKEYSGVVL